MLNIATKINKGTIEIVQDVQVCREGEKVGASEATLLSKLGIKPFQVCFWGGLCKGCVGCDDDDDTFQHNMISTQHDFNTTIPPHTHSMA